MSKAPFFAEIIESSLQFWIAQSWQWDTFPAFGSLVILECTERDLYGVVYAVHTGSPEGHRSPFLYQKTEAELKRDQPQIFELLATHFSCLSLGYREKDRLLYQWTPTPPKIHTFVRPATLREKTRFFSSTLFLHHIFNAQSLVPHTDDLLIALLTHHVDHANFASQYIHNFLETFLLLTNNDYRRAKIFIQQLEHTTTLLTQKSSSPIIDFLPKQ